MRHYTSSLLITACLLATLVACTSEAPSSEVVRQVIQDTGPPDRILKVTNLQYHCTVTRGSDEQKLPHPFYAYTADVQAIKNGEPIKPPTEFGWLIYQKTEGGPWSAAMTSRDAWNCE